MLELNLAILLACCLLCMLYPYFFQFWTNFQKLEADLTLNQANRYTQNMLNHELSYQTLHAVLEKDRLGRDKLNCQTILAQKKRLYYVENHTLYRQTKTYSVGVNPFSVPSVSVQEFAVKKLDFDAVEVKLRLQDLKTGKEKEFRQEHRLCNGYVVDKRL